MLVLWSLSAGYFPLHYPAHRGTSYWLTGLAATLLFFASVLTHELSHSVVAGQLGQRVRRITLFIFGGMAHLSGEPNSPGAEFAIAAVGPLTSLLRYGYAGFPVVSDGRVGLLTLFKVQDYPVEERSVRCVANIMRPLDASMRISASAAVSDALRQMEEADTGRLFVMHGDQLRGLITRSVIARFVQVKAALNEND